MAKPTLNAHGLLDPGRHPMSLDEVRDLFGRFQRSDRRPKLMDCLRAFVADVWAADVRIQIIVNGSFVMPTVDEPEDIDVVLILPADWDFAGQLRPSVYNLVSKRMVRRRHGFDVLIGIDGQASAAQAVDFFAQVNVKWLAPLARPAGTVKGLARVGR